MTTITDKIFDRARIYDSEGYLIRSGIEVEQVSVAGHKWLRVGSMLLWWADVEPLSDEEGFVCKMTGMTIKL